MSNIDIFLDELVKENIITNKLLFMGKLKERELELKGKNDLEVIYAIGLCGYKEKTFTNNPNLFNCYLCGEKAIVNYMGSNINKQCYKCFNSE